MNVSAKPFLAALLTIAAAGVAPAAPVPVAPAAHSFRLGALRLYSLRDMLNVMPNDGTVFGKDVGPAAVAAALRTTGAPADSVTLGVDALLVRGGAATVLIDTGLGAKIGGVLVASLAMAGVQPDAVTDILITHSHGDHVGGLLMADGTPAFPRARIHMSAAEWTWLRSKPAMQALATAIAPRVTTFTPGEEVVAGITAVSLAGHTPGHVGYRIVSQGRSLLDIGDSAHSAILSLGHPEWTIGYDNDAASGRGSREMLLGRLAASREQVFAPHFPFPGVGTIAHSGAGFVWKPARP